MTIAEKCLNFKKTVSQFATARDCAMYNQALTDFAKYLESNNAKIKNQEEALKRIIDGEIFFYKGRTLYSSAYNTFYSESMLGLEDLDNYSEWQIK